MKKVIIDTNAVMAIDEFKLDIFTALEKCCTFKYTPYVLEGVIDELEKIKVEQRGKHVRAAKLGLSILKRKNVKVLKGKDHVDDLLVEHSIKGDLVLTQDIELKKRLVKPYLTIRQKKKIMVVE
jgi:rRNA-processing protein FCF1